MYLNLRPKIACLLRHGTVQHNKILSQKFSRVVHIVLPYQLYDNYLQ